MALSRKPSHSAQIKNSASQEKTLKLDGKEWWKNGIRFQCQGSGKCCMSRGEYGFVFLSPEDRRRMAQHLRISTTSFTKKYCDRNTDGFWHLKEDAKRPDCLFLKDKKTCGVYEARPTQCRTWPFWPEVMNAKTWNKEVATFCPGIGKGPKYSREEIIQFLVEQSTAEHSYGN